MALPTKPPASNNLPPFPNNLPPLPPLPEDKTQAAPPESNDLEGEARAALLKKIADMAPLLQSAQYVEQLANAYAAVVTSDERKAE